METPNLESMSSKELKELKKKWYDENDETRDKIADIIRAVGTSQDGNYGPKYLIDEVVFVNHFRAFVDDYGCYTIVHVNNNLVMSTLNELVFIPGKWVDAFINKFGPQAENKELAWKAKKEEEKKTALIDKLSYTWNE